MTAQQMIKIAAENIDRATMKSSALLCLNDAVDAVMSGNFNHAKTRALKSMAYSLGIAHPLYLAAAAEVR